MACSALCNRRASAMRVWINAHKSLIALGFLGFCAGMRRGVMLLGIATVLTQCQHSGG